MRKRFDAPPRGSFVMTLYNHLLRDGGTPLAHSHMLSNCTHSLGVTPGVILLCLDWSIRVGATRGVRRAAVSRTGHLAVP